MYTADKKLIDNVKSLEDEVFPVSEFLTEHPETGGNEKESCAYITEFLKKHGYQVESPYCGLEYSFRAWKETGREKKIAVMCEYDALPEIGHACGHSISCGISLLTALALEKTFPDFPYQIELVGTPGEETIGGKCVLTENGGFDRYEFAIMGHIDNVNAPQMRNLACNDMFITFHGKSSHASSAPWKGRNALNAAELLMHGIALLRGQFKPFMQVHGVVAEGGSAPNVVPDTASLDYYTRAADLTELEELRGWIKRLAAGIADGIGVTCEIEQRYPTFAELYYNPPAIRAIKETFEALGEDVVEFEPPGGSIDAGNVDMVIPAFHLQIKGVNAGTEMHTKEFEACMHGETGKATLLRGAKVIASYIARLAYEPGLFDAIKKSHDEYREKQRQAGENNFEGEE